MSTSAIPSVRAASRSSSDRTSPRSRAPRSAVSLTDPHSPRDAQSSTTRAPESTRRASVPPQASDSSSGWAKTARIVRPAPPCFSVCASSTMALHDPAVHRHVLIGHALGAEAFDGAIPDTPPVERGHAGQPGGHLVEILEHDAGDPIVDHLADGAAVEG